MLLRTRDKGTQETRSDLGLAQAAAGGDPQARQQVNELVHPMIVFQLAKFCKRYCGSHRSLYRCSLPAQRWGSADREALLCEWGNGGYGWMLMDLTNDQRLLAFEGRDGASLKSYLFCIINSLPFYQRWQEWRLGRRMHIPDYVAALHAQAPAVFRAMRKHESMAQIASDLALAEAEVRDIARRIFMELNTRKSLWLLDSQQEHSLEEIEEQGHEPAYEATDFVGLQLGERLRSARAGLEPLEQFVLQSMVVEQRDALSVLSALQADGEAQVLGPWDRQRLYYFKRKCLARLARLSGVLDDEQHNNLR